MYVKNEYDFHNAYKDGDQNTDLPCGQLHDNVDILKSGANLKQVKMNFPQGFPHSGTR